MCDSEFLAFERALAAAEQKPDQLTKGYQCDRLLADQLVPSACDQSHSAIQPVSVTSVTNCNVPNTSGAGNKRKLPPSFAQTDQPPAAAPVPALHYQACAVCTHLTTSYSEQCAALPFAK